MSQTQTQRPQRQQGEGQRREGRPQRKPREEAPWIPKTILGKKVNAGEVTSMEEIIRKWPKNSRSRNYQKIVTGFDY